MNTDDDNTLFQAYINGEESAINTLVERYGDSLTVYLFGFTRNLQDAEDLMIEAFSRVIQRWNASESGMFKAYLFKTARNLATNFYHRNRYRTVFSLEDLKNDPASESLMETYEREDRYRILHLCLDRMDPELREAVWLVYFEDMSYRQVAKTMRRTERQVEYLLSKGREYLRNALSREGITHPYS